MIRKLQGLGNLFFAFALGLSFESEGQRHDKNMQKYVVLVNKQMEFLKGFSRKQVHEFLWQLAVDCFAFMFLF